MDGREQDGVLYSEKDMVFNEDIGAGRHVEKWKRGRYG